MKKQNQYLNVIKFLFSLVIILYHAECWFRGGYIVVEGFFMITGYLMMASISRMKAGEELSAPVFVLRKYKAIFPILLFSVLISVFVYGRIYQTDNMEHFFRALPLAFFELVPLQVAGFDGLWLTGVSWYLSAMLLASLILYPMACRLRKTYTNVLCPLMAVVIYGILCHNFHTLNLPNSWILGIFNTGLLRGIAGIAAGSLLWTLLEKYGAAEISMGTRVRNTVLELLGFGFLGYTMIRHPSASVDYVMIPLLFGLLYIGIGGRSLFSLLWSRLNLKLLGTVSTVVYLNHHYWYVYLNKFFPNYYTKGQFMLRYLALVAISSAAVWLLKLAAEAGLRRMRSTFLSQKGGAKEPK